MVLQIPDIIANVGQKKKRVRNILIISTDTFHIVCFLCMVITMADGQMPLNVLLN